MGGIEPGSRMGKQYLFLVTNGEAISFKEPKTAASKLTVWRLLPTPTRPEKPQKMAAVTTAVIVIVGLVLGWLAIEMACKPCLEKGREAMDRSLDPNYDPDDIENNSIRAPLNQSPEPDSSQYPKVDAAAATSTTTKIV